MVPESPVAFILLLFLLILLGVGGPLPYRVFYMAARNATRLDGTLSTRRLRRELKHVGSLVGELLLVIVFVTAVSGFAIIVVHEYIVPIPMVAAMLSQFHLDPVQWEYNIEHGELGDMGAQYEAWSRSRGFSGGSARFWQEFLWVQWIALAAVGFALAYSGCRLLSRFYGTAVVAYANGVLSRRRAYELLDLKDLKAKRKRALRRLPDVSDARFVDSVEGGETTAD